MSNIFRIFVKQHLIERVHTHVENKNNLMKFER